jgi:hypothetical protein
VTGLQDITVEKMNTIMHVCIYIYKVFLLASNKFRDLLMTESLTSDGRACALIFRRKVVNYWNIYNFLQASVLTLLSYRLSR